MDTWMKWTHYPIQFRKKSEMTMVGTTENDVRHRMVLPKDHYNSLPNPSTLDDHHHRRRGHPSMALSTAAGRGGDVDDDINNNCPGETRRNNAPYIHIIRKGRSILRHHPIMGPLGIMVGLFLLSWFVYKTIVIVLYIIPRIEKPFEDYPYLRGMVFNPFRYVLVKFFDRRPVYENIRTFVMTNQTAFVINLERDKRRMEQFWSRNHASRSVIERFPAHQWVVAAATTADEDGTTTIAAQGNPLQGSRSSMMTNNEERRRLQIQHQWEPNYPFLSLSIRNQQYGDAACSLSHLLLWKEKLLNNNGDDIDYIFVFEDDAKLLEPLSTHHHIQAPGEADVVFLALPAIKRVDVPWGRGDQRSNLRPSQTETTTTTTTINTTPGDNGGTPEHSSSSATRVIGGYGAWGYIITRRGAEQMIEYMKQSREPTDISLFLPTSVHVYLPISGQWPAVWHDGRHSSRRGNNQWRHFKHSCRKKVQNKNLTSIGLHTRHNWRSMFFSNEFFFEKWSSSWFQEQYQNCQYIDLRMFYILR